MIRLLAASIVLSIPSAAQFQPNWESLDKRKTPQWYSDAKFGIFIHWGVYAVPSFSMVGKYSEWYWNSLTGGISGRSNDPNHLATWEFHRKTYGEKFAYQDFAPMFKAELYDPDHWAEVFQKSGARYVVLTSKHHDGFALWPSEHANKAWGRPWNSVDAGPRKDLLGTLTASVRKAGLRMGFYYSLYEWYNPLWLQDRKRYAVEHMAPQFKDVVTRYRPSIIFSDGEWDMPSEDWRAPELLAWVFNESPSKDDVVVNDRWGKESRHKHGGYFTTEYTAGLSGVDHPWEESRGLAHSYGYNRAERVSDYRTPRELILMLVDLVSRGGNLLLDIGPAADGTIPAIMEERLLQMGDWMRVNGEAIHGTRPWKRTRQWSDGKVPEFTNSQYMSRYEVDDYVSKPKPGQAVIQAFFTSKGNAVYAIIPGWPGRKVTLKDVALVPDSAVRLLGASQPVKWRAVGGNLEVDLPEAEPDGSVLKYAYVLRLSGVR